MEKWKVKMKNKCECWINWKQHLKGELGMATQFILSFIRYRQPRLPHLHRHHSAQLLLCAIIQQLNNYYDYGVVVRQQAHCFCLRALPTAKIFYLSLCCGAPIGKRPTGIITPHRRSNKRQDCHLFAFFHVFLLLFVRSAFCSRLHCFAVAMQLCGASSVAIAKARINALCA